LKQDTFGTYVPGSTLSIGGYHRRSR